MTGEQQLSRLRQYVEATAKRLGWPRVARPVLGTAVQGSVAWRDLLAMLPRNMAGVEALDYLADQLHAIQKGAAGAIPPQATTNIATLTRAATAPVIARTRSYQGISVTPSAKEFSILCTATLTARRHGLRTHPVTVVWYDVMPDEDVVPGYCHTPKDGSGITIGLRRGLAAGELFATVVHEFAHVHDALTLGSKYFDIPNHERERRAMAFEAIVMLAEGRPGLL
jgi:hypothetical protein